MTACTCPHFPDYHRGGSAGCRCTACAVCGLGEMLHSPYLRLFQPKTQDAHAFSVCQCKGSNM